MDVFFGAGLEIGPGTSPSVAMNTKQEMVLAHVKSGHELAYRQGTQQHATVAWTKEETYAEGRDPTMAINQTTAIEVHRGVDEDGLYYQVGPLTNGRMLWLGGGKYDSGLRPRVAINDAGVVIEVHQSQNTGRLWYNIGVVSGNKVHWNKKDDFSDGWDATVALNNLGQAIVAYVRNDALCYRVVTTDGNSIQFHDEHDLVADMASEPAVAITDDGWVVLCYALTDLKQRIGRIDGTTVTWGDPVQFDYGLACSVAAQNGLAVQVHLSTLENKEYFSTSLITNRSRWMTDRLAEIGNLPLRLLILPGSHDAGMYTGGPAGRTQDCSIAQQLTYGLRWFDFRVSNYPVENELYINHGETYGPKLTTVLDDIRGFMNQGASELLILKFSHLGNETSGEFTTSQWNDLVNKIENALGTWLYRGPLPNNQRLTDRSLNDYHATVLVVVDGKWAKDYAHPGFWIYRDSTKDDAYEGHLIVYDQYSNTEDYDAMSKDQIDGFFDYTGGTVSGATCDLFLLSWTLTPAKKSVKTVQELAAVANPHLGDEVGKLPPANQYEKIINVVYVDYAQDARPSDVAISEKNDSGAHG